MLSLLLLLQATPAAQQPAPLSVPYIMRGPENTGREPSQVRWSPDGRYIYFRWLPPGTDWREQLKPYRVRASGGSPEQLTPAQADSVAPLLAEGSDSRDRRWRAVSALGDIWLVDRRAGKATRLTETREREGDPVLSTDTKAVYFTRDGNLYSVAVATGAVVQLTDIRKGPKPKEDESPTGQRAWLQNENRALLGAVSDRFRNDSIQKAERARRDSAWGTTIWLDAEESVDRIVASPTGTSAVLLTNKPGKARTANVPDFIAQSGYTTEIPTRDNVGDQQDASRVGMISLPRGEVTWLKPIPGDSAKAPSWMAVRGWNEAGTTALLWSVRRDFKGRYLSALTTTDSAGSRVGRLAVLDSLRDSAWVGGPCEGCAGWVDDSTTWFVSEVTGYAHLYAQRLGAPAPHRGCLGGPRRRLES